MDAYQQEMISLRHNFYHNNYPERIRNLDWRIEDNTQKFTNIYVKSLAKRI